MIDVVTTTTEVIPYGDFRIEHATRLDNSGVTAGWRAWCQPCARYVSGRLRFDCDARAAADAHEHNVDPAAELARMADEIPPLLDSRGVA